MGLSLYRAPPLHTGSLPQKYMVLALAPLYKALTWSNLFNLGLTTQIPSPSSRIVQTCAHYDVCTVDKWAVGILLELFLVTARKRSLGQGNIFTGVWLSMGVASKHASQVTWPEGFCIQGICLQEVCIQGVGRPLPRNMVYYGVRSTSGRYVSYWNAFLFHVFRFCVPELAADCLATFPLLPGPSADNLYLSHKQRICGFNTDPVEVVLLILEQITKGLSLLSRLKTGNVLKKYCLLLLWNVFMLFLDEVERIFVNPIISLNVIDQKCSKATQDFLLNSFWYLRIKVLGNWLALFQLLHCFQNIKVTCM